MVGELRVGRITRGKSHPRLDNFTNLIVCSFNSKWGKLSPMKLGPFEMVEKLSPNVYYPEGVHPGFTRVEDKQVCTWHNVENMWQYSKIYSVDVNSDNVIQQSFYLRRAEGMSQVRGKRRVFPKSKNIATLAAFYNGQLYDYQSSRYWYCQYYVHLARMVPEYLEIVNKLKQGHNLMLMDYDAPVDSHLQTITRDFIDRKYRQTDHPFGHGLVLACDILSYRPWLN